MAVGLKQPGKLFPVPGVRLAATHGGIKPNPEITDLVLIELSEKANLAATFTTNKFCAAPVTVAKEHLEKQRLQKHGAIRYLLVNSGNANAGTGEKGYQDALACCQAVAEQGSSLAEEVLPFSTGVIAAKLPADTICKAIPGLFDSLDEDKSLDAAQGIMTTDTCPKAVTEQLVVSGQTVTITGISKGSGMIKPDMATMLAYVATDAKIEKSLLNDLIRQAVACSFNSITVDGDLLKAKISTDGAIPKDGSVGAFGYGLLTDGTNNVLALTSHLCASDSPKQKNASNRLCSDPVGISILVDDFSVHDGANFHAHVLDLKPAQTNCTTTYEDEAPELEVDFESTVEWFKDPQNQNLKTSILEKLNK